MEDLNFTHTITVAEDDFITMEVYLNEDLEIFKGNYTFEEYLDMAFSEMQDDFLFAEDYVRHAIWEYHKDEILEKFKKWHENS